MAYSHILISFCSISLFLLLTFLLTHQICDYLYFSLIFLTTFIMRPFGQQLFENFYWIHYKRIITLVFSYQDLWKSSRVWKWWSINCADEIMPKDTTQETKLLFWLQYSLTIYSYYPHFFAFTPAYSLIIYLFQASKFLINILYYRVWLYNNIYKSFFHSSYLWIIQIIRPYIFYKYILANRLTFL